MSRINIKILVFVLFFILLFLQYRLWFEGGGVRDMLRLKKQLAAQITENEKIKKLNADLLTQVQHAHKSREAAESRARDELGMIKKGETFYQIVKKTG